MAKRDWLVTTLRLANGKSARLSAKLSLGKWAYKFGFSNRIIPLWNSLPDYVCSLYLLLQYI